MAQIARPFEQRELVYVGIARALAVPLFLALTYAIADPITPQLWVVVSVAFVYTWGMLALALSPQWRRVHGLFLIVADLVVMAAGVAVSGGPESQATVIFIVWTIAMATLFPPRVVLGCAIAALTVFAAVSVPFVLEGLGVFNESELRSLITAELTLTWVGVITFFVADAVQRRQDRIVSLSDARRRLLADALSAEDRARRRLSHALHDDALQTLLSAGQDLGTDDGRDPALIERARQGIAEAARSLRETIRGLHPAALEHGGLAGGLDAVVESAAARGGFDVDLRVDPAASGPQDPLIVTVVRELTTNVVKHADAERLEVGVSRARGRVLVAVSDDGRGMSPSARETALAAGHIGLASCAERVEEAGGDFSVESSAGRGTRVRVTLPDGESRGGLRRRT